MFGALKNLYLNSFLYDKKISKPFISSLKYKPSTHLLSSIVKIQTKKININEFVLDTVWTNINLSKNFGKGYCIKKGIKESSGDIIIIQDADLEYDPSDIPKLINPIKNGDADVVYGSRFTGSDEKRVLFYWHSIGNKFLTTLSNMFSNLNLTDMECCYKAFKKNIIKEINLKENRFGFEPEVTAKISKKDIKIFEVGIKYFGRKYSDGKKITWIDGFRAIYCIIFYSFFD